MEIFYCAYIQLDAIVKIGIVKFLILCISAFILIYCVTLSNKINREHKISNDFKGIFVAGAGF